MTGKTAGPPRPVKHANRAGPGRSKFAIHLARSPGARCEGPPRRAQHLDERIAHFRGLDSEVQVRAGLSCARWGGRAGHSARASHAARAITSANRGLISAYLALSRRFASASSLIFDQLVRAGATSTHPARRDVAASRPYGPHVPQGLPPATPVFPRCGDSTRHLPFDLRPAPPPSFSSTSVTPPPGNPSCSRLFLSGSVVK